ncbi:cell division protein FtsN [Pasteurellaceae bacterium LIM206]|nr:cell division protein FtsN [Pasteurellaceae bacterium LIM206]
MAQQRDYAVRNNGRKKKKSGGNKTLLLTIAVIVVVGFAAGLYLLKEKAPEVQQPAVETKTQPKSQLPSRPEEVWSYIKELESRTVPTTEEQQNSVKLSEKQKEELKKLAEKEKQAELDKVKRAEAAAQAAAADNSTAAATATEQDASVSQAEEEERRKAEAAKAEQAKKAVIVEAASADRAKAEQAKKDAAKKAEESKKAETAAKPAGGKFGLQCGAFKNKAQAESLQARLAMTGLNARVNTSSDWNRVVIGPLGDRNAANAARRQASSIANCVIIGM